uniref:Uncharacterized protein n=1 Tax=Rhizophora mucronata TaxID=61149 RepID=A0A2P2JCY3_RHIMU
MESCRCRCSYPTGYHLLHWHVHYLHKNKKSLKLYTHGSPF